MNAEYTQHIFALKRGNYGVNPFSFLKAMKYKNSFRYLDCSLSLR